MALKERNETENLFRHIFALFYIFFVVKKKRLTFIRSRKLISLFSEILISGCSNIDQYFNTLSIKYLLPLHY